MNRIKEIRLQKKVSQKDLAEAIDITHQAISLYEKNLRTPSPKVWQALADYFGVSVPYLQGKILFVDLSEDEQRIFTDVLDVLITTTDNKAIHVLEALLNSFKECYFEENTRIAPEKIGREIIK